MMDETVQSFSDYNQPSQVGLSIHKIFIVVILILWVFLYYMNIGRLKPRHKTTCTCKRSQKHIAMLLLLLIYQQLSHGIRMCGSRKYPYPSHGRFLVCIPPPLRNFRSKGDFDDPPPPRNFHVTRTWFLL